VAEVAYFSPEFGVSADIPQYSGGLGVLAGDHLKAASDLGVDLVGIGLLYREGFFRQSIVAGRQRERYEKVEPAAIGAVDTGVVVSVPIGGVEVAARVWRQVVGNVALYLLDTAEPTNSPDHQRITDRLYSGDRRHRLEQELVLGAGGVRALRALGLAPAVFHLNEGHACFLLLELLAEEVEAGANFAAAVAAVRDRTLFTTHTPVPAGIDRFDRSLIEPELAPWAERLGIGLEALLDLSVMASDGPDQPFNTAALCLRLCGRANGVSQLHAQVSRSLFAGVTGADEIEGITNGVHARTWVAPRLAASFDDVLGAGWEHGSPSAWERVDALDDTTIAGIRRAGRVELAALVEKSTGVALDPDACTIGFARRFATYKRAALLLRRDEELTELLADTDQPVQFVFAGKAHPADQEGKAVLHEIASFARSSKAHGRFLLVPDYDMAVAAAMYAGTDVWLNTPLRPREACGTSGEKAALNGGLNCSILDGWWADWFTDGIGWAIPSSGAPDADWRDEDEAVALMRIITAEVVPLFYGHGAPSEQWWATVRRMWRHLGPLVTAGRMVAEYRDQYYRPIAAGRPAVS
jgi:starch phosphorylase